MRATLLCRQLKRDQQQKMKDGVRKIKGISGRVWKKKKR